MRRLSTTIQRAIGGLLIIILLAAALNSMRPLPRVAPALAQLPGFGGGAPLAWPANAPAAVGAVGFGLLATHGQQTALPTGELAQAITALAVLQRHPLRPGQTGPVVAGGQLNEYQALQALLLPSADNTADSLATWAFGSMDNYLVYANQMVRHLGMQHTVVAQDASGSSPQTVSTPADLVRLGEAILSNPVLTQIVGQASADLPDAGTVQSTNWLLGQEGVSGIKAGGDNFLGAVTYRLINGKLATLVSAVMGAGDQDTAITQSLPLLNSAKHFLKVFTPVRAGQVIATYRLPWGGLAAAVTAQDVSVTGWYGNKGMISASLNPTRRAAEHNTPVGTITAKLGDRQAAVPVIIKQQLPGPNWVWRLTRLP